MIRVLSFSVVILYLTLLNKSHAAESSFFLEEPPLILPSTSRVYLQREAKITPEEYPLAQQIRPMLEQSNYHEALRILNNYRKPKSIALQLLEAQLLVQQQSWEKAEQTLETIINEMPDLVRAHISLSTVFQAQDKLLQAKESLSRAIALGASEPNQFALLGYLHMHSNDPHAAVAAYQQAMMLDPDNADVRQGLLFALVNSQQYRAADNLLSGVIAEDPANPKLWLQRANFALQQDDNQRALASVEVALRLGSEHISAKKLAMQLHLKAQSYQQATEYSKALIATGNLTFKEVETLLAWLVNKHQWQQIASLVSNDALNKTVSTNFDKATLWHYRAELALVKEDIPTAQKAWKRAIKLDPNNGNALLKLANLAAKNNEYAAADVFYQRAETINNVSLEAGLGRAQLYIEQFDYVRALEVLETLFKQHPHRQDLAENIRIIGNLIASQQQL